MDLRLFRSGTVLTIVQPFFGELETPGSPFGGYDPGLGACKWVYEKARVDDELDNVLLGTAFGAVIVGGFRFPHELCRLDCRGDSESEVLSQASSSAHSAA